MGSDTVLKVGEITISTSDYADVLSCGDKLDGHSINLNGGDFFLVGNKVIVTWC